MIGGHLQGVKFDNRPVSALVSGPAACLKEHREFQNFRILFGQRRAVSLRSGINTGDGFNLSSIRILKVFPKILQLSPKAFGA
jgi:hypothetical protein